MRGLLSEDPKHLCSLSILRVLMTDDAVGTCSMSPVLAVEIFGIDPSYCCPSKVPTGLVCSADVFRWVAFRCEVDDEGPRVPGRREQLTPAQLPAPFPFPDLIVGTIPHLLVLVCSEYRCQEDRSRTIQQRNETRNSFV